MTVGPSVTGQPKRVDRCLVGLLAVLFVATEVVGLLVPAGDFDFIPPRIAAPPSTNVLDELGPAVRIAVARVKTTKALRRLLERSGFDLQSTRESGAAVPPVFLAALPRDLRSVDTVQDRKDLFIGIVLPLILQQNAVILERRSGLERLAGTSAPALSSTERNWLLRLARHYRVIEPDARLDGWTSAYHERLLRRVDTVPVSLALAQSAAESGWGTSRFARNGNALFGQWTWDQGSGLVPSEREEGQAHAVRAFPWLATSVRAYAHNLNVSHHYQAFRRARAALRRAGGPLGNRGHALIGYLEKYSEEGQVYIEKIRSIIRVNRFGDFETARLGKTPSPPILAPSGS
jgi:Bax protein